MLKKLSLFSKNRIKAFLSFADRDPVFGARMETLQKAHGFGPDTEFYLEEPLAGEARGIAARFYGTAYLSASENADPLFALPYLKRCPYWIALEGRDTLIAPLAKELGIARLETSWCMLHGFSRSFRPATRASGTTPTTACGSGITPRGSDAERPSSFSFTTGIRRSPAPR